MTDATAAAAGCRAVTSYYRSRRGRGVLNDPAARRRHPAPRGAPQSAGSPDRPTVRCKRCAAMSPARRRLGSCLLQGIIRHSGAVIGGYLCDNGARCRCGSVQDVRMMASIPCRFAGWGRGRVDGERPRATSVFPPAAAIRACFQTGGSTVVVRTPGPCAWRAA